MGVVYIMQGIPGSGKSWLAAKIKAGHPVGEAEIFSADEFHYYGGDTYLYDANKAAEAHEWNRLRIREALAKGVNAIVDNTNIQQWQAQPYIDAAKEFGFTPVIVRVDVPLEVALARNAERTTDRKVPENVLRRGQRLMERLII